MGQRASVPELLTIAEAARTLGLGRSVAYAHGRLWRETGGKAGLPNVTVGKTLRVPRAALEEMLGRPVKRIPAATPRQSPSFDRAADESRDLRASDSRNSTNQVSTNGSTTNDDEHTTSQLKATSP